MPVPPPVTSFKLQISFGGLCMFVFDKTTAKPRWQVLMPSASMPGMPGMSDHTQRVLFDGAYLRPQKVGPQLEDIAGQSFDFTTLVGTVKQQLRGLLPWVSDFGGSKVSKAWATAVPNSLTALAARISLPSDIEVVTGNDSQQMIIDVGTTRTTFHAVGLAMTRFTVIGSTFTLDASRTLHPQWNEEKQQYEMFLFFGNLTGDAYDPTIPRAHAASIDAPHFGAYYSLLVTPPATPPIPRTPLTSSSRGMDPVTCMLSGGCQDGDPDC